MTTSPIRLATARGTEYRDLNGNGRMDPYEDADLPVADRVADLLGRLSLPEKVGLMFQTVIEVGADGGLAEVPGRISKSSTREVVLDKHLSHFNVHGLPDPATAARWQNTLQQLAEQTPHGIPITISSDPRHAYHENPGVSFAADIFSCWPEPLGLAALRDPETVRSFADTVRQEYVAVGIRAALHPSLDLATEPRWGRQAGTFGQDPDLVAELSLAYLRGLQTDSLGPRSVACTAKHFPGGGPQRDGEDAHFPYGREQVYRGGQFDAHLRPFRSIIAAGTSAIMPYYGLPVGLVVDGEPIEEVGFAFNRQIVTDLLRRELAFDGVVVSDWELINDNWVGDRVLPARAWGVEHLDAHGRLEAVVLAGVDQLGGEECVQVLLDLVASGRVSGARIDESVGRLLTVKFLLGLFDDPYVDELAAVTVVDNEDFHRRGHEAQARSVTVLGNGDIDGRPALPLPRGLRLYTENVDPVAVGRWGTAVASPQDADIALVRLNAPFEPRGDLFLEEYFHQGSLDFPPGLIARLARVAACCPVIIEVTLDRPAILTPLLPIARALVVSYGSSDAALLDALTGVIAPEGRLPFDIPRSMAAVRRTPEDVSGSVDPVFRFGDGLRLVGSASADN